VDKLLRWPTTIPPRTSPSFSELQDCSGICCARSPLRRCAYWRLSQKPRRLRTFCVEVCSAHIRQRSRARPAIASPIPATTSPARPRFAGGKALRQTAWGGRQHLRNRFRGASRMWLERPERLRPCDGACGERRCASVSLARAPLPRGARRIWCGAVCCASVVSVSTRRETWQPWSICVGRRDSYFCCTLLAQNVLTLVTKTTLSRTGSTTYVLQYPERPQGIGGEEEIFRRDYVQIGIVKVDSLERSTQH